MEPHRAAAEIAREGNMKLLLTSAGVKNPSIRSTLVNLLGKPIADASALFIPTASTRAAGAALRFIWGRTATPLCELGWKSLGVLELTALPSVDEALWVPEVRGTDALLVGGGDALYLCHWMRQSGLADLLLSLRETVYVGVSGGSMVMAPNIGEGMGSWRPPAGGDSGLGMVDFSMFPHVDNENMPDSSMADAEKWAATVPVPGYAIDDQTAIKVTDDAVEVVSEGHWKLFPR